MNKAIFFDRDGCLIVDKHYLSDPDEVEFFPDTIKALKLLQSEYVLFIVTNQSGIGRGYFTEEDLNRVHQKILQIFESEGIKIKAIAYCPHTPEDGCECRKPLPKLVLGLCRQFDIDIKNSFFIGDKNIDAECGKLAGMQGRVVRNKYEDFICHASLQEFAQEAMHKSS